MQIKAVFQKAVRQLQQAAIQDPELEVSIMLAAVLAMTRTAVLLAGDKHIPAEELALFEKFLERRLAREPLAYITGIKEFWSLDFKVTGDVLIPRPETELLLEKALAVLKSSGPTKQLQPLKILDLGTGSGVIAVVLALELAGSEVTAVDYSYKALKVARHNANKHGVGDRIDFINCDWFSGVAPKVSFDAVISNPPYVARESLAEPCGRSPGALQPEVGLYEPRLALDGGERGTREISRIAAEMPDALKSGGWFFMEIGAGQQDEVLGIFTATGEFESLECFADYSGLPRIFQARKR